MTCPKCQSAGVKTWRIGNILRAKCLNPACKHSWSHQAGPAARLTQSHQARGVSAEDVYARNVPCMHCGKPFKEWLPREACPGSPEVA